MRKKKQPYRYHVEADPLISTPWPKPSEDRAKLTRMLMVRDGLLDILSKDSRSDEWPNQEIRNIIKMLARQIEAFEQLDSLND